MHKTIQHIQKLVRFGALICAVSLAVPFAAPLGAMAQTVTPLYNAHAHNDYWHAHPLLDSLDLGFMSVEADIMLKDGALLVGHVEAELTPAKTLESLYLQPLAERIKANGGQVYGPAQTQPFQLMVDIKKNGSKVYPVLVELLKKYSDILCRYEDGKVIEGPVQIVISGSRPLKQMQAETTRYAFMDWRYSHKDLNLDGSFAPLAGEKWSTFFSWYGMGDMPESEKKMLTTYVNAAHERGQKVRFYSTPDYASPGRDRFWQALLDLGVDYINTDDIQGLHDFLTERRK